MEFVKAKTILSKVKYGSDWYGIDYNMNLYRGCSHGCIYCDSRSNCYHIDNFDIPKGKENALAILESELSKKKEKGVVGIGSMSDTYNPLEKQYEQTRGALKLISKYNFGVSIDTKSDLILRDLEAIKTLSDNGIFAGIMMNPVLPFITDDEEDIKKLVKKAYESGAKFIHTYMGMTLRENQRDYYFEKLDKHFKGLKEKYIKYYGERYNCAVPNYKSLYKVFTNECDKYGILYNMKDIIKAYKKEIKDNEQISLF